MEAGPMTSAVSTGSVDYLQRSGTAPDASVGRTTHVPFEQRRLLRVRGIGLDGKTPADTPARPEDIGRTGAEDLLAGLYGSRVPVAFRVGGGPGGTAVSLGTWSSRPDPHGSTLDRRIGVVQSVLRGLYPSVDSVPDTRDASGAIAPLGGIALGVPTATRGVSGDRSAPVDRVIRAMAGTRWATLVLAYPLDETLTAGARNTVVNEMRLVEASAKAEGAPSPLAEQYIELLKQSLGSLTSAMAVGSWRTAVYLLGDGESYPRLASVWRSVFSGETSLPEPVRVFDLPAAAEAAAGWGLIDGHSPPGPGAYSRPFEYQTLLSSSQLAAYVHLPRLETPGFSVDIAADFDVVPAAPPPGDGLRLGAIVHRGRPTEESYRASLASLTRHVFVSGVTGSGKTNTIFHLLDEVDASGVPFLVVEPAKTEYRTLLSHPRIGPRLQVFTLGDETIAPLRLNPFEVLPGTPVLMHLDLLRSVFTASFGMWNPLPQILERCLYGIYEDRGWDVTTGVNDRLDDERHRSLSFPTLSDLIAKVDQVIGTLGYDEKITSDMRAALLTRLAALRVGGKGRMLDTQHSLAPEDLFERPTVLELERLGDDDDKAFVIGLALIRLAEYRRAAGFSDALRHVMVIEEAHRLLSNTGPAASAEQGDPMFKAVQAFVNLLAEVRVYGQSVVVADQVPVRLAPEVVKNTNLKITHRLVAVDDRSAVGSAMAMEDHQTRSLTTLAKGEAAAFAEGDDAPLLVRMPLVKDLSQAPSDDVITAHMAANASRSTSSARRCPVCGQQSARGCDVARAWMQRPDVQRAVTRLFTTVLADPDAVDRLWPDVLQVVRPHRPAGNADADESIACLAARAAEWFTAATGARARWSYGTTKAVTDALSATLPGAAAGSSGPVDPPASFAARRRLFELSVTAHRRHDDPFPRCDRICAGEPPLCMYRRSAEPLLEEPGLVARWRDTEALPPGERYAAMWELAKDAGHRVVEFPDASMDPDVYDWTMGSARRASLCFAQQMIVGSPVRTPDTVRVALDNVLDAAAPSTSEEEET
jgi:hypothetical protein